MRNLLTNIYKKLLTYKVPELKSNFNHLSDAEQAEKIKKYITKMDEKLIPDWNVSSPKEIETAYNKINKGYNKILNAFNRMPGEVNLGNRSHALNDSLNDYELLKPLKNVKEINGKLYDDSLIRNREKLLTNIGLGAGGTGVVGGSGALIYNNLKDQSKSENETIDSAKSMGNDAINWIQQNPELSAAIASGALATGAGALYLRKKMKENK